MHLVKNPFEGFMNPSKNPIEDFGTLLKTLPGAKELF